MTWLRQVAGIGDLVLSGQDKRDASGTMRRSVLHVFATDSLLLRGIITRGRAQESAKTCQLAGWRFSKER